MQILSRLSEIIWGPPTILFILLSGIYITVKSRFYPLTHIKTIFRNTFGRLSDKTDKKGITPFKAVSTALAGTMGVGNIAGVATAIVAGGAGSIFWMWVSAFFCMMIKYCEVTLAMQYREKRPEGWIGGAMVCLDKVLHNKKTAAFFAAACVLSSFGIGNLSQSNTITTAFSGAFGVSPKLIGALLAALVAVSIIGGIKTIANISSKIIPLMSAVYILASVIVLISFRAELPSAVAGIFAGAFSLKSIGGGMAGYAITRAVRFGMARGIFTHEAGLGSSPIAHCSVETDKPLMQGYWGIAEVFIDTIVVCTLTALVILCTGACNTGLDGIELTSRAFQCVYGEYTTIYMAIIIFFFAYASILGWSYYGESCINYLTDGKTAAFFYKTVFIMFIYIGAVSKLDTVWLISDIFSALMIFPNMYMVMRLHKRALYVLER